MPNDKADWRRWVGPVVIAAAPAIAAGYALARPTAFFVSVLMWIAINAMVAGSIRFVMLIGEINVAAAGFFGIGAYASAIATLWYDLPLFAALLLGAAVAAIISAAFGFVTFRARGAYFLLIGFAFTEVLRLLYTQTDAIGGNSGMVGIFPSRQLEPWFPAILIAISSVALLASYGVEMSTLGKLFLAVRGNERIVQAAGINALGIKIACLATACFMVGLAGALQAHAANVISPGDFGFVVAAFALAYVKIGGEGHVLGAVGGAVLLTLVEQQVRGLGALEHALFGAAIVAAMLILPDGLWGLAKRTLAVSGGRKPPIKKASATG